jgi:cellulose synthase/poly-beta-1,6-N-acetylglucosamine synthase-like glycosyltransferase
MSITVALAGTTFFLLLVALWPFGPYQLSLAIGRRLRRFPLVPMGEPMATESFAICLCAYNEAAVIEDKIQDLLRLSDAANGTLRVLVYVDGATDGTAEIVESYSDRIEVFVSDKRHGKTHGMNLLVQKAHESVLIFTDANVLIDPSAISVLQRYFSDPMVGCVCGNLTYINPGDSATAAVGARFWRFNEWTKGLETATGSVIGADGSLFAIRRRLHEPVPKGLFDDLYLSLLVMLKGFRVVRAEELRAYETHATDAREEFRRKARIACECMRVHFVLWPRLRQLRAWTLYKYLGHRFLRWVDGYVFALAFLFGAMAIGSVVGLFWLGVVLAGSASALSTGCRLGIRPALLLWSAGLAFVGNGVGVWRALAGERVVTWEVPESARRATLSH